MKSSTTRKQQHANYNKKVFDFITEIWNESKKREIKSFKEFTIAHGITKGIPTVLRDKGIIEKPNRGVAKWIGGEPTMLMANSIRVEMAKRQKIAQTKWVQSKVKKTRPFCEPLIQREVIEIVKPKKQKSELEEIISILPKGATLELKSGIKITL